MATRKCVVVSFAGISILLLVWQMVSATPSTRPKSFVSYIQHLIRKRPEDYRVAIARLQAQGVTNPLTTTYKKQSIEVHQYARETLIQLRPPFAFPNGVAIRRVIFEYSGKELTAAIFGFERTDRSCVRMKYIQREFGKFGLPYVVQGMPPALARKRLTSFGSYIVNVQGGAESGERHTSCVRSLSIVFR